MSSLRRIAFTAVASLGVAVLPAPARAVTYAYTGIRPGTLLLFRQGNVSNGCTANFVFQTTGNTFDKTQQLYIGTAGHCGNLNQSVQAVFVPTGGTATVQRTIGRVVVDNLPDNTVVDLPNDFALIEIDLALNDQVSPSMAFWGGPTDADTDGGSAMAHWVGHGGFVGALVPRVGDATWNTTTLGVDSTIDLLGDSGAPVTTSDGVAVGSLAGVAGNLGQKGVPADIFAQGPSIAHMLSLAGHPLATCASADPWMSAGCPD